MQRFTRGFISILIYPVFCDGKCTPDGNQHGASQRVASLLRPIPLMWVLAIPDNLHYLFSDPLGKSSHHIILCWAMAMASKE
jgi:hypothetical protein